MCDYFDEEEECQALRLSELSSEEFDREVRALDQTTVNTTSDNDAEAQEEQSDDFAASGLDGASQAFEDIKLKLANLESLQAELPADIYEEQKTQLLLQLNSLHEALESLVKAEQLAESGATLLEQAMEIEGVDLLDTSLAALRASADNTPDGHPDKPTRLTNLGVGFFRRFDRVGDVGDLERGIDVNRRAVDLTPDGHPKKPMYLNNLGNGFFRRFERVGDIGDLERGIDASRRAIDLTPDDHPDKPGRLSNLGNGFRIRFERVGDVGDLERGIDANRRAVDLTPDGHPTKPGSLSNLGVGFFRRFDRVGDIGDLERAIDANFRAVDLTPDGHPGKPMYLNNFGSGFHRRFELVGDIRDLERAIDANRRAVDLTPDGHPAKPMYHNNLGNGFFRRFERVGDIGDLERAIDAYRRAVNLTPDGHPDKPNSLSNLGNGFRIRFERVGDVGDLGRAIDANFRAVDLTPDGHSEKSGYLNNLGIGFFRRFERVGDIGDLERAIDAYRRAVDLTPDSHSDKPACLSNLGGGFETRFQCVGKPADFQHALQAYLSAADQQSGPPSTRLDAVKKSANMCWSGLQHGFVTHHDLVDIYERAISLIPQVAWLGNSIGQRFERLTEIGNVVNGAVAATIAAGQPTKAVEWLDQGRGVVWGQLLQLRSPLDDLRAIRPDLAEELQSVSRALENSAGLSAGRQSLQDQAVDRILQKEASDRIRLAGERDRVLETIRNIDGFERFLMPKLYSTLAHASKGGPVILINVHESRCDALVVYSSSEDPIHVFLSKLSQQDVTDIHHQFLDLLRQAGVRGRGNRDRGAKPYRFIKADFSDILSRLWLHVVHPILKAIEPKLYGSIVDVLPHVTWCATGPLAFLPLHAAGEYGREDGSKIFDFVVSSYTPTLSTLLQTSTSLGDLRSTSNKILVVSQPQTPGFNSLPESLIEVAKIRGHFSEGQIIHRNDADATVNAVLGAIHEHRPQCIHFACHGVQDADDPTGSAFFLHDGKLELRQLMGTSTTGAALAFLSACQTAKGDVKLPEEAVHLAAGMLAVGYRSVVGTLWSIKDKDAPVVADEFYRRLKGDDENGSVGDGGARVAHALHGATEVLRKQVGESEFLRWAAFVHLGQ